MNMEISHILQAGLSSDMTTRGQAEKTIDQMATQNFSGFLKLCSMELSNETKYIKNRQLAATLIKNMLIHMPNYVGKWEQLPNSEKDEIKGNILSTLASQEKDIRKAAALVVAGKISVKKGICKIELPMKSWPGIIEILVKNCSNENENYRLSSIITLGYISQEITAHDLTSEEIDKILTGILQNLNSSSNHINSSELENTAIIALINYISYAKKNFSVISEKVIIMDAIYTNLNSNNVEMRLYAMQCLVEVTRCYYDFLDDQMAKILEVTIFHMERDQTKVGIQAYELWCSLSDEENARLKEIDHGAQLRCYNYCNIAWNHLFNTIQKHLLSREKMEDEEWNLAKGAASLIGNLSQCCQYSFVEAVLKFVGEHINDSNPMARDSSVMAFAGILEGRDKDNIKAIVLNALDSIIKMLTDPDRTVRETSAWCIEKICEHHTQTISKQKTHFEPLVKAIKENINRGRKSGISLCNALHFIAKGLRSEENKSNCLSPHLQELLSILYRVALNQDSYDKDNNLALGSFFAMGSLIENSAMDTKKIIEDFFSMILSTFQQTLQPGLFNNTEIRNDYQNYIASVIEACFVTEKIKLEISQGKQVMMMLIDSFIQREGVYEEGLLAASSISLGMGESFAEIVPEFSKYLTYALNTQNEVGLCRVGIHAVSDMVRALGPHFSTYMNQFMPLIFNILRDNTSDRSLKINSFNVISDLFVANQSAALSHYNEIMGLIGIALEAAIILPNDFEDFETVEYFDTLREHIMECITCVIHTLKDLKQTDMFNNYVQGVMDFISKITQDSYNPNFEIVRCSVGIIGDLCEIYRGHMKQVLSYELVTKLIGKLKLNATPRLKAFISWSEEVTYSVFK